MRAALLIPCSLLALGLCGATQAEAERRTLQGSTEQAADAPGWNGRLPEGVDSRSVTGAGSRLGLDSDYGAGRAVGYGAYGPGYGSGYGQGYRFDAGPCGWNPGPGLPGSSRSAGSIDGGSFRSTRRCADGYPGLPLRQREQAWPGGTAWWPEADRREPPWRR